jgi:hypothetical protein
MPIRSEYFPADRSVTDTWYTEIQINDLGKTWQMEGKAEEETRYFVPDLAALTPAFLNSLPQDKPAKFMFYANVGGGHWIGCGVIVSNGRVTVASADSLHPDDTYDSLRGDKKRFVDDIAGRFAVFFGADNVAKKTYKHAWTQTNWRGDQEEGPNSCGPYTVENMRRFLADSQEADMERNPGSLIVREQQLARMTNPVAIRVASNSDVLMDMARKFSQDNPGKTFTNDMLKEFLRDPNFRMAIAYQRNTQDDRMRRLADPSFDINAAVMANTVEAADKSEAEGIIAYMNREMLGKVKAIEAKERDFLKALNGLQAGMGGVAFKRFVEGGFNIPEIKDHMPNAFEFMLVKAALPTLSPSECDRVIRQSFSGIKPPFVGIEDERLAQEMHAREGIERRAQEERASAAEAENLRVAREMQENEMREARVLQGKEEMESRPAVIEAIQERIRDIRAELPNLRQKQKDYNQSRNPFKPDPGHTVRIKELKAELDTLSARLSKEKEELKKEGRPRSQSFGSRPGPVAQGGGHRSF